MSDLNNAAQNCLTDEYRSIQPWHVVVCYQLVNWCSFFFNAYGKFLPYIVTVCFWISLVSFTVILIAVPADAPSFKSANYVFTDFTNNTGWSSSGIAFIVGLINTNWPFVGLDCATHLAEEVARPQIVIPLALLLTVAIGFGTSWPFVVSMMFSLQDLETVSSTPTLVPIIEIFRQAINTKGATALQVLIIVNGIGAQIACHTWQARLCWSFARDGGLPGHQWLGKVNKHLDVPLNAHLVSCTVSALIGLLYLGSTAAFNS